MNDHFNIELFKTQYIVVVDFVEHLTYARTIGQLLTKFGSNLVFWSRTADAHRLRATILWCAVFGTDSEATHWKRLGSSMAKEEFRKGLYAHLNISSADWAEYHASLTNYRNTQAGHVDPSPSPHAIPNFDLALEAAFYYDDWVRQWIALDARPLSFKESEIHNGTIELLSPLFG